MAGPPHGWILTDPSTLSVQPLPSQVGSSCPDAGPAAARSVCSRVSPVPRDWGQHPPSSRIQEEPPLFLSVQLSVVRMKTCLPSPCCRTGDPKPRCLCHNRSARLLLCHHPRQNWGPVQFSDYPRLRAPPHPAPQPQGLGHSCLLSEPCPLQSY